MVARRNEQVQCPNGHWYDPSIYSTCPICNGHTSSPEMDIPGETSFAPEGFGSTEPDIPPTSPQVESGFTEGWDQTERAMDGYGPTEPVWTTGVRGFNPVVGWLVCVEGSDKGKDYRIISGYNYIGRSEKMDICIQGDMSISRDRHAMIAFDDEDSAFYFGPADGKAIVKVNGKAALNPVELQAYDVIKIGTTKLLFIPFCGDRFSWNE